MSRGRDQEKAERRDYNRWARQNQNNHKPYDKNKRHEQKQNLNDIVRGGKLEDIEEAFDDMEDQ